MAKTYKVKITIIAEITSPEYDTVDAMMDELASECEYDIPSTPNVTVVSTTFEDIEKI